MKWNTVVYFAIMAVAGGGCSVTAMAQENTRSSSPLSVPHESQRSIDERELQELIRWGEFPAALSAIAELPDPARDRWLNAIALRQAQTGAAGQWLTARQIQDEQLRTNSLAELSRSQFHPLGGGQNESASQGGDNSQFGGITLQDFQPLINLIQSTIQPDSWAVSQGEGTILPYVSGIYVNPTGEVQRVVRDQDRNLNSLWQKLKSAGDENLGALPDSEIRHVSLRKLERECQWLAAQGRPIPPEMQNLAGLYDLRYVILDRENQDILLAGPAGPWRKNAEGISLNVATGRPVLQLDDLVTCLRAVWYDQGRFGCAITPRQANLAAVQTFLAETKLKGAKFQDEFRQRVGEQDIDVFGIDPQSSTARILVEADYRMKLVGMGLETSVPGVPSYMDRAWQRVDQQPGLDVARWWFTLNYSGVRSNPERTILELLGSGVQVLSETEMIAATGERIHTHQAVGPTKQFAEDFTKHFETLALRYPIYNELRNVFDLAMAFGLIQQAGWAEEIGWQLTYFGQPSPTPPAAGSEFVYTSQKLPAARSVASVINVDSRSIRQGGRQLKQTLIGVSGGIDCPVRETVAELAWEQQPLTVEVPRALAASKERNSRGGITVSDHRSRSLGGEPGSTAWWGD